MQRKKVLVCPLNWGMGHATRDIPIIYEFLRQGFEVVIAGDGDVIAVLEKEFPGIKVIVFPSYSVIYSRFNSQLLAMFYLLPKIILWTRKEHKLIEQIALQEKFDIIFSDNRFGIWSKRTYNIFMTHQLRVKFPGILKVLEWIYTLSLKKAVKNFNEIWIPDFQGHINLSGELSHLKFKIKPTFFIGPLSRFENNNKQEITETDVLFILSGPEPQRSIFEKIIHKQTINTKYKIVLVRGSSAIREFDFDFPVYDVLGSSDLYELIVKSKLVVCRSGYSSVMDMFTLQQNAVFVPTPGQTEQEYLANYLKEHRLFYSMSQQDFNLESAMNNFVDFPQKNFVETDQLMQRIVNLKNQKN